MINAQIATGGDAKGGAPGFAIPSETVSAFVEQARSGDLQPQQEQPQSPYGEPVDPYGAHPDPTDPYAPYLN